MIINPAATQAEYDELEATLAELREAVSGHWGGSHRPAVLRALEDAVAGSPVHFKARQKQTKLS